jgi:exodeoxyribonuclease VII small subunit
MPKFNFEKSIGDLETIVDKMENEQLTLEESLKNFEKGIKLTQQCQEALKNAEQQVKILLKKNGTEELTDFIDESE